MSYNWNQILWQISKTRHKTSQLNEWNNVETKNGGKFKGAQNWQVSHNSAHGDIMIPFQNEHFTIASKWQKFQWNNSMAALNWQVPYNPLEWSDELLWHISKTDSKILHENENVGRAISWGIQNWQVPYKSVKWTFMTHLRNEHPNHYKNRIKNGQLRGKASLPLIRKKLS